MQEIFWKVPEPERTEAFLKMSDEEAQAFFDEYMRLHDERLNALVQRYNRSGGRDEQGQLDSREDASLLSLWIWAKKYIHPRELTPDRLGEFTSLPVKAIDLRLATRPLSEDSLILLNDIAYYFAEVLIDCFKGVGWKICKAKDKRYVDNNQPVLGGFSPTPINPRRLVESIAEDTLNGNAGNDALQKAFDECFDRLGKEGDY